MLQGDLLLFAAGPASVTNKALDRVRQFLGRTLNLIDASAHNLLWVTDFPMFEWNEDEQRLEALHHPFTAPNPDDLQDAGAAGGDLRHARALAYDMVYNGVEIGGGSLRIYRCAERGRGVAFCCLTAGLSGVRGWQYSDLCAYSPALYQHSLAVCRQMSAPQHGCMLGAALPACPHLLYHVHPLPFFLVCCTGVMCSSRCLTPSA